MGLSRHTSPICARRTLVDGTGASLGSQGLRSPRSGSGQPNRLPYDSSHWNLTRRSTKRSMCWRRTFCFAKHTYMTVMSRLRPPASMREVAAGGLAQPAQQQRRAVGARSAGVRRDEGSRETRTNLGTALVPQIPVRLARYCPCLASTFLRSLERHTAPQSQIRLRTRKRRTGVEPATSSLGSHRADSPRSPET